jgi:hypothetical protein
MLLSEAIRLGATLGPQARHFLTASGGASCVLGAAARAIGLVCTDYQSLTYDALQKAFPVFQGDSGFQLIRHITNLNDFLYLSREEIADWIVKNNLDCEAALGHLCDRARDACSYQGNERIEVLPKCDRQQRRRRTTNLPLEYNSQGR